MTKKSETDVALPITKQQSELLQGLNEAVKQAQATLNVTLAAVVAGHGYSNVPVVGLDAAALTLTVRVPKESG